MRCDCQDKGCKAHTDEVCCTSLPRENMSRLYRVDMEDNTGSRFCPACTDDAMGSGLFTDNPCEDEDETETV